MAKSGCVQVENCSCVFRTSHIPVRRMNGIPLKGVPSSAMPYPKARVDGKSGYVQVENCSCVFRTSHIPVRRMNGIPLKGLPSSAMPYPKGTSGWQRAVMFRMNGIPRCRGWQRAVIATGCRFSRKAGCINRPTAVRYYRGHRTTPVCYSLSGALSQYLGATGGTHCLAHPT